MKIYLINIQLNMKIIPLQVVAGSVVGGGYTIYDNIGTKKTTRDELQANVLDQKPEVPISR